MKRALILVEGQTEERFVKDVLAPHRLDLGLFMTPTLLVTKVVKSGPNFKGGVSSFGNLNRIYEDCSGERAAVHWSRPCLITIAFRWISRGK